LGPGRISGLEKLRICSADIAARARKAELSLIQPIEDSDDNDGNIGKLAKTARQQEEVCQGVLPRLRIVLVSMVHANCSDLTPNAAPNFSNSLDFPIVRSGYERILGTSSFCLSVFPFNPVPR
jgi:hypothetical protein